MNISQLLMHQKSSGFIQIPSEDGRPMELSNVSGLTEDTDSLTYQSSSETKKRKTTTNRKITKKRKTLSTQESRPQNNQKISGDKSETLRHPTLGFKYFLTRDRGSTSNVKASRGFFRRSCAETSERLWYPTETDCAELLSNSSNSYVTNTKLNSWFTTKIRKDQTKRNCWRTSWPLPMFSVPGSMEKDRVETGNAIQKSAKNVTVMKLLITQLKILMISGCDENLKSQILLQINQRILKIMEYKETTGSLSKTQQKQLIEFNSSLEIYNSGILPTESIDKLIKEQDKLTMDLTEKILVTEKHSTRSKKIRIGKLEPSTRSTLRKYMTASRKIFNIALDLHNKGIKGEELRKRCVRSKFIPEELKGIPEHIRQKAYDKFCSSKNSSEELGGCLRFISRKKDESWVGFQKIDCKMKNPTTLSLHGKLDIKLREKIDDRIMCDVEITERFGVFYAIFTDNSMYLPPEPVDINTSKVCSLDMGERTFGTLYDPDGTIAFLGTDVNTKVKNRLKVIYQKRNGLKTNLSYRKRIKVLNACRRASAKMKNMIKEMHNRLANWLVSQYDLILIGKMGKGVMKTKRRGKRVLQSLSHYSFRRTLLQKATLARKVVKVVSESYTTKQCNRCGYINWKIGSSEVFTCKNCKIVCHRDVHSGRGIFIRSLSE